MKRLAIVSTHPIQYNAPLFRTIAADGSMDLHVFYSKQAEEVRFDKDFGQNVEWDIPLTDGYVHSSYAASTGEGQRALIAAIEAFKPDAVLVFGWNFPGHWPVMKHFKGRCAVWFRGDSTLLDPMPLWKRLLRRAWLHYVYRHIDTAFYVGQANKRYYEWCGLKPNQLVHAPHAVDNAFFKRDDASRCQEAMKVREKLGIGADAVVFLFVGKLEALKQPLELARAFGAMLESNPGTNAHLVFIGSGALQAELNNIIEIGNRLHAVGFKNQSQMPVWYRVGDAIALVSTTETWGLAINEAMACGCSALVSDRVGCAEDLVAPLNPDAIVGSTDYSTWPNALFKHYERIAQNRESSQMECRAFIQPFAYSSILAALKAQWHG